MDIDFFVNVVDSPSASDIFENRSEGALLKKAINLNEICCVNRVAINKANFNKALYSGFLYGIKKFNKIPLLHISCHGCKNGIILSCGDELKWDELKVTLMGINSLLKGNLILCMSSCEGFHACRVAMQPNTNGSPFFAIVGNTKTPRWSDTLVAYTSFYHLISSGYHFEDAVNGMKAASGNNDWAVITAADANKLYINYLNNIRLQEVVMQLEKNYHNVATN